MADSRTPLHQFLVFAVVLLAACAIAVFALGLPRRREMVMAQNEAAAETAVRMLTGAMADFRANDRDGNKVLDFWTGDVAGLRFLKNNGKNLDLIPLELALADASPQSGRAPTAYHGYYFRVLQADDSESPPIEYQQDTDGKSGKVHHPLKFGFCAYPAEPGVTGRYTIIINEYNTSFANRNSQGVPISRWPSDMTLKTCWVRNCGG